MSEEDIKSYMEQFNVDRETAIQEINELLASWYEEQADNMNETYRDIIRSTH